jgi:hypothetical protein
MTSSQPEATSHHEARHAVVAYSLDIEFDEEALTIKPTTDYAGCLHSIGLTLGFGLW